ncbi:ATP-grasp domain-containing protein [Cereibacter azotoformans]|uniref:3-methylcrotonoyl-CoA carboxylase alpha subunit n=1 Tax=Cereibacter azotoformans TaxID=43057 RepID=A0A2T5KAZ1_9RHOB|nr:biotin carboxylase N-terminal domain-containing protein [Cereibacter azotoformans]AXQ93917.1 3-methylcrotonyl-CoA carboxylase [Cereibacter sphaeroides]MBO4168273.1 3-methylcrotonyl-CoA carboxylase [Cereibacter azotoformans]PTR19587.1 3-methylcrotonoyl-CoA carboxylase alpha subunit [Cereibacter azotoformans]UIJ29434.1 ATP-grasp domain-containing protein [Cereibacter azotoformans]
MFRKILIANRGEIAVRIIATARRLGVATVAVHSDADADALHVALADEAVPIGGPQPADSYLRGDRLIEAALATGAEAIHPGYGFLSENPGFVEAVEAAGLTFIGPSAAAIRAMGLKDAAKALMARAGVPVVPGYHGEDQEPEHLALMAGDVGYPVLIKAVAGGGGKGMRRVERAEDFTAALASARAEARTAFGNEDVLIEKWIDCPRHIEVQVFGDGSDAVHLYERDCSLQRRHQKVIEEAPAPGMTPEMRAAMGEAAVRAARAIGYRGAGTVEFIVDGSEGLRPDRFWFMEMNTRLQVEHPVTEAVTGIDLVEWQLRVAAGEPLPLAQDEIPLMGHAFEARLYAEDVPAGFLPATGRLDHLRFADGIRADTGVRTGDRISPWYDPMIAKIVAHGPSRASALNRLARALEETEVAGTVTNLAFLGRLARHPGFAAGEVDTGLIARDLASLTEPVAVAPEITAAAILTAELGDMAPPLQGFSLWGPLRRHARLRRDGEEIAAMLIVEAPGRARVELGGVTLAARLCPEGWEVAGRHPGRVLRTDAQVHVFARQGTVSFEIPDPFDRGGEEAGQGGLTLSPMPGLVREVAVRVGEHVAKGDRLAVIEAMKMEHVLAASRDGRVAEVLVEAGAQVEAGAALVRLEDEDG